MTTKIEEKVCKCGCPESMHVDNQDRCFDEGCGCQEFEEDVCEFCDGTGEVETYYRDSSTGYNWVVDGTKKCVCKLRFEDENLQD